MISQTGTPETADGIEVTAGTARRRSWRFAGIFRAQEFGPAAALLVIVLAIGLPHSKFFANTAVSSNIRTAAFVAIVAYGMVFLLAMTEIDLSVGGIYGVCFWLAAKWMSSGAMSPWIAAALAIFVGMGMGAFNGALSTLFRAPVIIVTLGTFSLYRGLVNVISGGQSTPPLPTGDSFFTFLGGEQLGIPVAGWVALLLGVVLTFAFTKTRFGAMVRAIGSNPAAARFAGVPVDRMKLYTLMMIGGLAALSGVLSLAFFESGDPNVGSGLELQVIAAAIIGGTAVSGGTGSVPGAAIGAAIVAAITSGLVFFNVDPLWGSVVTGLVILLAIGSDGIVRNRLVGAMSRRRGATG